MSAKILLISEYLRLSFPVKLISATHLGGLIELSFERPDGKLDIFCQPRWQQIPSCDLWLGTRDPVAADAIHIIPASMEETAIANALEHWLEEHLSPRLWKAFETPAMHIRLTDEDTRAYFVWRVFDHLRHRNSLDPHLKCRIDHPSEPGQNT